MATSQYTGVRDIRTTQIYGHGFISHSGVDTYSNVSYMEITHYVTEIKYEYFKLTLQLQLFLSCDRFQYLQ